MSFCPERLQQATYDALLARPFEPVLVDGEPATVRTQTRVGFPI